MTRDEFIRDNPIALVLEQRGTKVIGGADQRSARCPFHEDKSASMSVNVATGLWHCHAGCGGGSVIDLVSKFDGITPIDLLKKNGVSKSPPVAAKPQPGPEPKYETVCTYDYQDAFGGLAYQVVRQHAPSKEKACGYVKTFRQRQPDAKGGWVWSMEGAERVLYRLPEVLKSKTIWLVEGEKDAETLVKLGFCATTNVGGAGKWLDGYTETLAKKHVAICGDTDEAGKKHIKQVFESIAGKVKTLRMITLPGEFKDITEYVGSFKEDELAKRAVRDLYDFATPFVKGVSLPIFTLAELELKYQRHVERMSEAAFDLAKWLPSFGAWVRPLVAGELILLLGATGIGKTAALSNVALAAHPIPILFFELELPAELMYERMVALKTKMSCKNIEQAYRGGDLLGEEALGKKLAHIHICTESRLSVRDLETLIIQSELKIGQRPKIVLIDYIGLIQAVGKSRYERVSQIAEDLKIMAKTTQTVVIVASQVNRDAQADSPEITLKDGKDSGSLENSSGLVLGMWRDPNDASLMHIRVLKNTKGSAGHQLQCNYNLDTLAITERSRFNDADIPARRAYAAD